MLSKLQRAIASLLAATPGETRRAADVERTFGVDPKLGWQVHRIATSTKPLTTGTSVPAPISVEKLLKAAAKLGVSKEIVDRVEAAFEDFEKLVEDYAGDRDRFQTMVAPLLNEDSEALDLKHKKSIYRGMSHVTGVDAQADMFTTLMHPGDEPGTFCSIMIHTTVGLHRLRAGAPLCMSIGRARLSGDNPWDCSEAIKPMVAPIAGNAGTYLLRDYCSRDLANEVRVLGAGTMYPLLEIPETLGRKNRITIATASLATGIKWDEEQVLWSSPRILLPSQVMISDVLFHPDVHPARHPVPSKVSIYNNDRIGLGMGEPEHVMVTDLLNMHERCDYLGQGVDLLIAPDAPRNVDMLAAICKAMNWNSEEFHAYRTRVEYPVLRSTVRTVFDLSGR